MILLGLFGLFGQLFNGVVYLGITIASVASIIAGFVIIISGEKKILLLSSLCALVIFGCVYDAYEYFSFDNASGNFYGVWIWSIPLVGCMLSVIIKGLQNAKSLENP